LNIHRLDAKIMYSLYYNEYCKRPVVAYVKTNVLRFRNFAVAVHPFT